MNETIKAVALGVMGGIMLAGCQTSSQYEGEPGETAEAEEFAESVPLSRPELYAYFSEHTQLRPDGDIYYTEFGTFRAVVDNELLTGTWASNDGGEMCREYEESGESTCEIYVFDGEAVNRMVNGVEFPAPEIVSGNQAETKELYSPEQTLALISGMTVVWVPNGGAYYAPDGTLNTLWDGYKEDGTWEIDEKGGVCWNVPSWGKTPCEYYYDGEEGLMSIYGSEESAADEFREGNVLDSL